MTDLYGISYSPWTQKARWALEHHQISFRYVEHVPMIGEPKLRMRLRSAFGKVTVPVLFTGQGALTDSLIIAEYAEEKGAGSPLFPVGQRGAIGAWNAASERALAAGRGLVVARTGRLEEAKIDAVPTFVPKALRPSLTGLASIGVAFFRLKYNLDADDEDKRRADIATELRALRVALDGKPYLLGELTYADMAMAVALQLVRPVSDSFWKLKKGTREAWGDPSLEGEFSDLLEWRDGIFAKHRFNRLAA